MQNQKEVKLIHQLFTESQELLKFGTWSLDLNSNKEEWSDGLVTLLDYNDRKKSEASSKRLLNYINEEQRELFEKDIEDCIKNKTTSEREIGINTATGKKRIVCSRVKFIQQENGNSHSVIGVIMDTTDQSTLRKDLLDYKQMMLEKEKFLRSGSWEYDIESQQLIWSEGKYRLFGYDPIDKELLPVPSFQLIRKHVPEPEFEKIQKAWQELLTDKQENTWEYNLITLQGKRKRIQTYGMLIRDNNGKPHKVFGASRDITRMRNYEESLKIKVEELARSNKELEEFAYIASHDLQEPLRKITAFSERLKDKSSDELGSEGILYLDRMLIATENMRILIDNLLEFSRTSRHNQAFTEVDLLKVLSEVITDLELKIEESDTQIHFDPLPVIEAIPSQMRQLITNLISNAIKFRKPGSKPRISIKVSEPDKDEKEQHRLRLDDKYFKLTFSDEGIGFEQEYSLRIFQIFQRLHGKSEYPGSGIGLAICKKIVENHGGVIFADGNPGYGAAFYILIPEKQLI